jgi:hypothetical protein
MLVKIVTFKIGSWLHISPSGRESYFPPCNRPLWLRRSITSLSPHMYNLLFVITFVGPYILAGQGYTANKRNKNQMTTQLIAWGWVTTSCIIIKIFQWTIKGKVLGMVTDLRSRSYFIGCLLGLNSTVLPSERRPSTIVRVITDMGGTRNRTRYYLMRCDDDDRCSLSAHLDVNLIESGWTTSNRW